MIRRYLILGIPLEKKLNGVFSSHDMFVMMADIKLKEGTEDQFKAWFSESNKVLCNSPGFISRKFLKSSDGSGYKILVEHESKETFIQMHKSPEHDKVHPMGHSFMAEEPIRKTFTLAAQ